MRRPAKRARGAARAMRAGYLAIVAVLALFVGCDGDNIFGSSGPGDDPGTIRVRIIDPGDDARTIAIGDSVEVAVEIEDAGGIVEVEMVGVAYRPNPTLGPDIEVVRFNLPERITFAEPFPNDTTLRRRLFPTGDATAEQVHFQVIVRNANGDEALDAVEVSVGGPEVSILSPPDGQVIQSGGPLNIRIQATYEQGISGLALEYASDFMGEGTLPLDVTPSQDSVFWTTQLDLPAGTSGDLRIQALAYSPTTTNPGRSRAITINVQTSAAPDDEPPEIRMAVDAPTRMELTDSIRVRVTANDEGGTGVARMGVTASAINGSGERVTLVFDTAFSPSLRGEVVHDFMVAPFNVRPDLPDTVSFEFFAFAIDGAENGNCAVAVRDEPQQLECVPSNGGMVTEAAPPLRPEKVVVTAGRTVMLPTGGTIADAVVDTLRQRLYLSNLTRNRVEVLELGGQTPFAFQNYTVGVGAQPWGLFLNGRGDSLFVANSGGTNISVVSLDGTPTEDLSRRVQAPNVVLYEIQITHNATTGFLELTGEFLDFSDRPQFVAQDSLGRILYSTVPTGAAPDGTLRVAYTDPSFEEPEVKMLFTSGAVTPADETIVIANVDSVKLTAVTNGHDLIEIWDHEIGFPSNVYYSGPQPIDDAIETMIALGSDIFHHRGTWIREQIGLSDTTFVSASGNRGRVAFGEGATGPTGRIILWHAEDEGISNEVSVVDLVGNASDRINGVALNRDGSLGVARGDRGAFFFTPNLQMIGSFAEGLETGGAGATLHPDHDARYPDPLRALSFVGTDRNTISIINSIHFFRVGEIEIRDQIVGPLRASPPLPDDNAGRVCPTDPDCVVVKLYGVTSAGGVVVVDVRSRDLVHLAP